MLYPSIFGENLFDDFFRFPDFGRDVEKKLYGKHAAQVMKTDVHEHDDHYEIVIDLPGFKKDQINLELQNGYLTVSAAKGLDKDEKSKKGKLIRQERYAGAMQRSFYIGDTVTEADVKAGMREIKLALLEADGVIESRQGAGFFVTAGAVENKNVLAKAEEELRLTIARVRDAGLSEEAAMRILSDTYKKEEE